MAGDIYAACGVTNITWGGAVNNWNTAANWSPVNVPSAATENAIINAGTATVNATLIVGCVTLSGAARINGSNATARVLTYTGDNFTSPTAGSLLTWTTLSLVMGPHSTPALPQTFTFNEAATLKALTVASSSVPGAGAFGATVTNTNAGTAVITTLANSGLNSSKYVGNIRATTYTNTQANSLDIENGTFQVNLLSAANTVTGGSIDINPNARLITTTTFNPVAGFTTNVLNGAPKGILTVTTTSAPAGTLNVDGTMTTTAFNATATSTTTIGSTGTITSSGASVPRGILNVSGSFSTTTFNPFNASTTTINAGGVVTASSTSAPAGTLNVNGSMSTTQFNPTATANVTIGAAGSVTSSGTSTPLGILVVNGSLSSTTFAPGASASVTINAGGSVTPSTSSIPGATSTVSISGTLTTPTFTPTNGATITVNSGGNLNATTTSNPGASITVASGGTFTAATYSPASTSTTNISGTMNVTTLSPANGSTINVKSGGILNATTFTPGATANITVEAGGTLNITTATNTMAATVNIFGTATITNMPTLTTGSLDVKNGGRLILTNGITLNAAAVSLKVQGGGTLQVANAKTVTLANGTFQINGTEDTFPQSLATKGTVEALSGGTFNFTTTGGTLNVVGFQFSRLGLNGLTIGGTTIVSNLRGGQFTNLSTSYASMKAVQINTTGVIPAAATNIAWTWGAFNDFTGTTPTSTDGYKLITSTGCAGRTIDFTGWTGDWYENQPTFNVLTKVSAVGCTINMSASTSSVSILFFNAVPFNNAIDLRWRTNAERMHLGFNVYRSDMFSAQFQQINKSLIRNTKNPGSNQASYRFVDQDVVNGSRYYYYIEDVETTGKKVMHGPVSAIAMAGLGSPPVDNAGENTGSNPKDPTDDGGIKLPDAGTIPNPTYEDLGNGIKILSRTNNSIRVEILSSAPVFTSSSWNAAYQDVSISGYSKMLAAGSPELPEKDLMIEVFGSATSAEVYNEVIVETPLAAHLISPAPDYALNGSGALVPGFIPDPVVYNKSEFYPSTFFGIQSELVTVNKEKFIKLRINPLMHNPVSRMLSFAGKITLDIGLDGNDWSVKPPVVDSQIGPYSISNTLKIEYGKSGIYQITYEDMASANIEGPFGHTAMSSWKLYYKDTEIPMEVSSANGSFGPGDTIRFYAPFESSLESHKNQLILSPVELTDSGESPKRMDTVDVNPAGEEESSETSALFTKTLEKNLKYIDGVTLNDNLDHFFYADLVNFTGMDALNISTTLPEIDVNSTSDVQVKFHVRGRPSMSGLTYKHHVAFYIGGIETGVAEFDDNDRRILTFLVSPDHFTAGSNNLKFNVLGSYTPANENEFVLVEKVEIVYRGANSNVTGINNFSLEESLKVHQLKHFSTNQIQGYDITDPLEPKIMTKMQITSLDNGATFNTGFYADDLVDINGKKHYSLISGRTFLKPMSLALNAGITESLKNSTNRADLIIYGSKNLTAALQELIDRRIEQGLEVMTITPAQVYGEFSFGVVKSAAIKEFINTALRNWDKPPKYLLILGDATYDPLDNNVDSLSVNLRSALESSTLPAPLIAGRFVDFSGDNFFVSSEKSHLPQLAVGRLPTNDPGKIRTYVQKVLKFENGEARAKQSLKNITFFADQDLGEYERFNEHSKNMISAASGFNSSLYDRGELGSKAQTKEKIKSEFNAGPLLISLMGHGAFDRFGDDIFNIADAKKLTNTNLPIVATWNCESAYFYDANNSYKSLGEELIFNPDGGAIVYMGSTTQTTPPAQAKLALNFFSELSRVTQKTWSGIRFGELLYQAKLGVGEEVYEKDIVNSFNIIGDPSLIMPKDLFPEDRSLSASSVAPESVSGGGGSGCSANASDGSASTPWKEGLIEWLFYILTIIYGTRRLNKIVN